MSDPLLEERLDRMFGELTDPKGLAEAHLAIDIAMQFVALRERRGLTQKQLADCLGKTQQAISKIENPWHQGHNLARLKEAVAAMDAYLDVTIVPLEDAEAYRALSLPKPALEDMSDRAPQAAGVDRASPALDGSSMEDADAKRKAAGERGAA